MNNRIQINIPHEKVVEFCRRNHIQKLSFFGSVLRGDFGPDSDVDILVEFLPGMGPGLIGLSHMELELSEILGRKVDLRTPNELSKYFREEIVSSALVEYAER
ncbi:MAG: nucleotidyltransferase family protein [Deltaproteobacteria bacterium]|nr:nucleotidyltransferase family protein [Deltaproteobacteria bacterium]